MFCSTLENTLVTFRHQNWTISEDRGERLRTTVHPVDRAWLTEDANDAANGSLLFFLRTPGMLTRLKDTLRLV